MPAPYNRYSGKDRSADEVCLGEGNWMLARTIAPPLLLACLGVVARAEDGPTALPIPLPEQAATAAAPPGPGSSLTLEELEQIALGNNPMVAQAVDRFEQARGRALQAGAYPNPLIIWSAPNLGAQGTAGQQQGFFQQPIVTGGKLRVNRARYEVDVESNRWLVYQEQLRVRNGVRMRHLQLVAQQEILTLRKELARAADEVARATREKFESGHAIEPDFLTAENEAIHVRSEAALLDKRYVNSWREFAAFLGRPEMPPTPLEGGLGGELRELAWEPTLDRLLRESPELRVARLQVRRQELTLDRERREPIPDLVLRGGAGHDPANGQTTGYTQLYVEVPLWDRNRGNIHTAEHGLAELRRDVERVRFNLQQRLARDFNHYQTSLENVRSYRDEVLPRARRAFELYLEKFTAEDIGYSRVQSARGAYMQAAVRYLEELLELRRAEVAIEGLELVEQSVEADALRPPASGRLSPPGQGIGHSPSGGGVPVGRPTRSENPS
jgi:cobalt-zinc-cadmium efflux system outer membrane protein